MNTKLSRLSAGIIVLFAVFGMIAASQAMATTAISTKQTNILVVSPAIQSKINAFIVKLKAKRVNHSSDDSWNRYLDGKIEQIDIIRPKYPQAAAILNALAIGIKSLKEQPSDDLNVEDILSDADTLPSLPFCAQPPMPVCSAGMSCIQSFPQPKTYMNHTDWKKDQAKYLYSGICKSIPPICPNYAAPLAGWCKGTVVPQGKDANGCQLPPKCELTASGVQFFGMKDIYDIGEKIDISVKNAGMKDFSFYGTCGLNYKITNLNGRQLQLNNPMISFDCMQGGVPSIIKAGETRSLGSWDQKEWRESGGMVADNFQTYQVWAGIYKISAFGIGKEIKIGSAMPMCPAADLAPGFCINGKVTWSKDSNGCPTIPKCEPVPQCPLPSPPPPEWCINGTIKTIKDANGCITRSECIPKIPCPSYAAPLAGWCNGRIIEQGKDINGCQLPPKCDYTNTIQ